MDRDECWQHISEQRRSLAELLAGLTDGEWEQPSLCAGWRVRDVAAHVAMAPQVPTVGSMIGDVVRARGSFDRMNHDMAARHATRPTSDIVDELRTHADSRRLPVVTNHRNILFDVLVHSQDIAVPLGRSHPVPPEAAGAGAERVWTMGWPFWARRRLRGIRLTASDTDWSAGTGLQMEGPVVSLLLLLTGRAQAALPDLSGPGLALLAPAGTRGTTTTPHDQR